MCSTYQGGRPQLFETTTTTTTQPQQQSLAKSTPRPPPQPQPQPPPPPPQRPQPPPPTNISQPKSDRKPKPGPIRTFALIDTVPLPPWVTALPRLVAASQSASVPRTAYCARSTVSRRCSCTNQKKRPFRYDACTFIQNQPKKHEKHKNVCVFSIILRSRSSRGRHVAIHYSRNQSKGEGRKGIFQNGARMWLLLLINTLLAHHQSLARCHQPNTYRARRKIKKK